MTIHYITTPQQNAASLRRHDLSRRWQQRLSAAGLSSALAALALCAATSNVFAQSADNEATLAIAKLNVADAARIKVSSEKFSAGSPIPPTNSAYAEGASPSLAWTAVQNAQSYAVIVEDPDARPATVVHWVIWNIPGSTTSLIEGLENQDRLVTVGGAFQGTNSHQTIGYYGPHPPASDPAHHYHFEVFALDRMLDAASGSTRDQIVAAASGHVLADGELVATFAAPVAK